MAEAFHDRAQMRSRRGAVLQGREGRGHALHRQRPIQAGRIRHRTAGGGHRRRTRHAVAVETANPDPGMHRIRHDPERQLHQGRGTLRAESGIRLLLSPALQRAAVSEHRNAGAAAGAADSLRCAEARVRAGSAGVAGVVSSLRYLLADFIGDDDDEPPFLPDGLPEGAAAVVSEGIHRLIEYQSAGYAKLYVDRLRRFVGRHGVDDAMFGEIARLMAMRMSYEDPIRIAQRKLAELIGALPAVVAEPVLDTLDWVGWAHKQISIRFSTRGRWSIRRLKIEAALRRWRLFSVRYARERA